MKRAWRRRRKPKGDFQEGAVRKDRPGRGSQEGAARRGTRRGNAAKMGYPRGGI